MVDLQVLAVVSSQLLMMEMGYTEHTSEGVINSSGFVHCVALVTVL